MRRFLCLVLTTALVLSTATVSAEDKSVDLELLLAVDSSASVDAAEFSLQMKGLAEAFRDAQVREASTAGPHGAIAVAVLEWSSVNRHRMTIPWTIVDGPEAAEALAGTLETSPRLVETGATALSSAILAGVAAFDGNGFGGLRRVIDVSGDGYNNQGPPVAVARSAAERAGVTVNGLAIENQVLGLAAYFEHNVITGIGAFTERALDYEDYIEAIRRKLLREIRDVPVG